MKVRFGFTLAELLIALVILGVIATFTIPKVLQSQQDAKFRSVAKEAATVISGAYETYKSQKGLSPNVGLSDLTPYINYVRVDSNVLIDDGYTATSKNCAAGDNRCIRLHSGAAIYWDLTESFGGTASTNCFFFVVDPDGVYSNTTTGSGKAVWFFLYYNGRITDGGNVYLNSASDETAYSANPGGVPPWFSWN